MMTNSNCINDDTSRYLGFKQSCNKHTSHEMKKKRRFKEVMRKRNTWHRSNRIRERIRRQEISEKYHQKQRNSNKEFIKRNSFNFNQIIDYDWDSYLSFCNSNSHTINTKHQQSQLQVSHSSINTNSNTCTKKLYQFKLLNVKFSYNTCIGDNDYNGHRGVFSINFRDSFIFGSYNSKESLLLLICGYFNFGLKNNSNRYYSPKDIASIVSKYVQGSFSYSSDLVRHSDFQRLNQLYDTKCTCLMILSPDRNVLNQIWCKISKMMKFVVVDYNDIKYKWSYDRNYKIRHVYGDEGDYENQRLSRFFDKLNKDELLSGMTRNSKLAKISIMINPKFVDVNDSKKNNRQKPDINC